MISSILRFSNRLSLSEISTNLEFKVLSYQENMHAELFQQFQNDARYPILELYHTSREGVTALEQIMQNGFQIPNHHFNNKGQGIYLSDHSRYSAFWGSKYPWSVLICLVIADPNYLCRYRSELKSGSKQWNSEYVLNPQFQTRYLIYPQYLLRYQIVKNGPISFCDYQKTGYVELGKSNCPICDKKNIRCDCQQYPLILNDNIIELD